MLKFMDALRAAKNGDEKALITAGECMYGAHDSYKNNCHLSTEEVDFLVEAVRKRGVQAGFTARRSPAAAPAARWRSSANSKRSKNTSPKSPPNIPAASA